MHPGGVGYLLFCRCKVFGDTLKVRNKVACTSFLYSQTLNMLNMNPLEAIKTCVFKKPLTFTGRASKSEYFGFACTWAFLVMSGVFLMPWLVNGLHMNENVIITIWGIIFFGGAIPLISATVRRLRDTSCSGWLVFLIIVPAVGPLLLLWLLSGETIDRDNNKRVTSK